LLMLGWVGGPASFVFSTDTVNGLHSTLPGMVFFLPLGNGGSPDSLLGLWEGA
jgi:hypothetical protein